MNPITRLILAVGLFSFLAVGCASVPKVLFAERTVGDRFVQYYAVETGEENLYDFHMRVCNMEPNGELVNCVDSLILNNVHAGSLN